VAGVISLRVVIVMGICTMSDNRPSKQGIVDLLHSLEMLRQAWSGNIDIEHAINRCMSAIEGAADVPATGHNLHKTEPQRVSNDTLAMIRDQCETGLMAEHNCPAVFALSAILAEIIPESEWRAATKTPAVQK